MTAELDIPLLRTFVAAAEAGSLARAAALVHRSPPAVSMRVARLEAQVGHRLLDRDTRNLALTPAGETLLHHARRVLAAHDAALAALAAEAVTGRLVVGAPDDYVSTLLPPVLARFARLHPRVEIEVVCRQTTALLPMLQAGEVGVAFVTRGGRGVRGGAVIRREPMAWVSRDAGGLAPPWERRPLPVALWEAGSVAREHTLAALADAGIPFRAAHASPSLLGLLAVVEAGLAVAALPACAVPRGAVVLDHRHGLPPLGPLEVILARRGGGKGLPEDAFAAVVHEVFGAQPR
jgi:DNA-binding transcriptional LysR family regulator